MTVLDDYLRAETNRLRKARRLSKHADRVWLIAVRLLESGPMPRAQLAFSLAGKLYRQAEDALLGRIQADPKSMTD